MRIPFDTLDSSQWLAWSDYERDSGREKAADWGAKVGKALQRFAESGSEVGMHLVIRDWSEEVAYRCSGRALGVETVVDAKCALIVDGRVSIPYSPVSRRDLVGTGRRFDWGRMYWRTTGYYVRKRQFHIAYDPHLVSPSVFIDPWAWPKLSQKFFQCVVSRSRGIKATASA
jgi:hypothetical protein